MNPLTIPRHPSTYRFPLPNDIWVQKLKPQAFVILALAMRTKMSIQMAERQVDVLVDRGLVTCSLLPTWTLPTAGNFFTLPDEVFYLNLSHGAITVYAYLLCCEDRRSHQCHPSYSTIAETTGLSVNTVMKHITTISDKQLITVERTSYIDRHGMKQNGNNLYTILPIHIQQATDAFYQQQLDRLESPGEHQRVTEEAPT